MFGGGDGGVSSALGGLSPAVPVQAAKGRRGMTFVSASWGFDPQAVSGDEIVRERMREARAPSP
jgi:hypothetical protein